MYIYTSISVAWTKSVLISNAVSSVFFSGSDLLTASDPAALQYNMIQLMTRFKGMAVLLNPKNDLFSLRQLGSY